MTRPVSQSGNILFYILVGVVLFAALNFTVAQMMRGGQGNNTETKIAAAGELIQYADTVRNAVQAMKIGGVVPGRICFDSPMWGNASYSAAACSDPANKVFDANGGGVVWDKPIKGSNDGSPWLFTAANGVAGIGTVCAGAACADMKMVLPNVGKDLCLALNNQLGVANPNDEPPVDVGYDATPFTGAFTSSGTADIGDEAGSAGLSGKMSGCFKATTSPSAGKYHFYRVLLSR